MDFKLKQQLLVWLLTLIAVARAQSPIDNSMQELSSDLEQWKRSVLTGFQESEKQTKAKVLELEKSLEEIRVPPVGFIYVEYGSQLPPSHLWPSAMWDDISSSYAGRFFRAVGGESALFGVNQEDWCPRVDDFTFKNVDEYQMSRSVRPAYNKGYDYYRNGIVKTGGFGGSWTGLAIDSKGGEVRPKNQAVRLWKRAG